MSSVAYLDKASYPPRRAAAGILPSAIACAFTTDTLAMLRLLVNEVRIRARCARTLPEIVARGKSSGAVHNTISKVERLGL
jgi:hypothetical protein